MLTEKDLVNSQETERASSESFLKGIADFLKWTSTVAAAAVIWIGSLSGSLVGWPKIVALLSLATLLASLVLAVLTMRRVLTAWSRAWTLAIQDSKYVLVKKLQANDPASVTQQKATEAIDELLNAVDESRAYSNPTDYARWTTWHVGLLVFGLIAYALAQGFPAF